MVVTIQTGCDGLVPQESIAPMATEVNQGTESLPLADGAMRLLQLEVIGIDCHSGKIVIERYLPTKDSVQNPRADYLLLTRQFRMRGEQSISMKPGLLRPPIQWIDQQLCRQKSRMEKSALDMRVAPLQTIPELIVVERVPAMASQQPQQLSMLPSTFTQGERLCQSIGGAAHPCR